MKKLFLSVALLLATMQVCAQANIAGTLYASNFAQWTVSQGNNGPYSWSSSSVCTQATSGGVTFRPFTVGTSIRIVDTATPGNTENVTVTAVNINGSGCNIATSTPAHQHFSFYLASATAGLQEAINYSKQSLGTSNPASVVIVTPAWSTVGGTTTMITPGAQGSVAISVLDERTSVIVPYTWQSTLYVAQTFGGLPGGATGAIQYNCSGAFCGSAAIADAPGNILQPNQAALNRVVQITDTTAELGAQVQAAYNSIPNCTDAVGITLPCGLIAIAPGTYTWTTPVTFSSPYVGLKADNVNVNHTAANIMLQITNASNYTSNTSTALIGGDAFNVNGNSGANAAAIYYNQVQSPKFKGALINYTGTGSFGMITFSSSNCTTIFHNTERGRIDLTTYNDTIGWFLEGSSCDATTGYGDVIYKATPTAGQLGLKIAGTNVYETNSTWHYICNVVNTGTCLGDPGSLSAQFITNFTMEMEQTVGTGGTARSLGTGTVFGGTGYLVIAGGLADSVANDQSCSYFNTTLGTTAAVWQCHGATGIIAPSFTDSGLVAGHCVQASTGGLLTTTSTPCATVPTYTIGTTLLTPNGSNPSLAFFGNTLPAVNYDGISAGSTLQRGYMECTGQTFAWQCLTIHVDNNTPSKVFNLGVATTQPYIGMTTGTVLEFNTCEESGSSTCADSILFTHGTSSTQYGGIGPTASVFTTPWTLGSLALSNVTGSTQCLQADAAGNVTGTSVTCSATAHSDYAFIPTSNTTINATMYGPVYLEPLQVHFKSIIVRTKGSTCTVAPAVQFVDLGTSPSTIYSGIAGTVDSVNTSTTDGVFQATANVNMVPGHYYGFALLNGTCTQWPQYDITVQVQ